MSRSKKIKQPQAIVAEPQVAQKAERSTLLLRAAFLLYAILTLYGVLNHEPWRDEAQAWLLVRDTSIEQLFRILPSEGHPPLWYLLIMPLAKLDLPYAAQSWLTVIIMSAAVYLLLFKTALHPVLKLLLPFGFFFLYEYGLFARSYCLIVFFSAAIISLYPHRFERPWLFALCITGLFNTHVLVFSFVFALSCLFILDALHNKKTNNTIWFSFAAMMAGGLYLLPYLAAAKMTNSFSPNMEDAATLIDNAVLHGTMVDGPAGAAWFLLLLAIASMAHRTKPLLALVAGIAGILYILGYRFPGSYRHEGIIYVELLCTLGIAGYYVDDRWNLAAFQKSYFAYSFMPLSLITLLQLKPGIEHYMADINETFSDSKNVAAFLQSNGLDKKTIVSHQAWSGTSVLPYLPHNTKMYYAECQRYGTYYVYDSCFINRRFEYAPDYAVDVTHDNFKNNLGDVVMLFNHPVQERALMYLDVLYTTTDDCIRPDERFFVYKFKDGVR